MNKKEEVTYTPPYILYADKKGRLTPESVKMLRHRFETLKINRSGLMEFYGFLKQSAQFYNWISGHRSTKQYFKVWTDALIECGAIDEVRRI
jgi:hypothetical protein